jgi:beta-alanine--pyruvate transaminase
VACIVHFIYHPAPEFHCTPVACAAGLATLGIYESEGLLTRARTLAQDWEDAAHGLRGLPHVIDVRTYGLICGLELAPQAGKPGARGFEVFLKCFERGVLVRQTGDIIALSPPLIVERAQIERIFGTLGEVLRAQ